MEPCMWIQHRPVDGDDKWQVKTGSDVGGDPYMVGMDNVGFKFPNGDAYVLLPGSDIGSQLTIVEVIKGLHAARVGGEAREIEIELGRRAAGFPLERDNIYIKRDLAPCYSLILRNNDRDFMTHP